VPWLFLDFEATSLDNKTSTPIEIAWVDEGGNGEAHLIRPAPGWTDWDESAARTHGIHRDALADGISVHALCERLIALDREHTLLASAPSWDGHWLSMLLRAAGHPRHLLRLQDTEVAFVDAARRRLGPAAPVAAVEALIAGARAAAEAGPPAHRALADARREWSIWHTIAEAE
jgi:hypothetical protein